MFGGRMPYMTEENWLTVEERKDAKLQNEDGEEVDEDSIDLQARFELSDTGVAIQSARLPGTRIKQGLQKGFAPGAAHVDFEFADQFITPSRIMGPPDQSGQVKQGHLAAYRLRQRHQRRRKRIGR